MWPFLICIFHLFGKTDSTLGLLEGLLAGIIRMRVLLMKQISHILIFVQTANNKIK
jgi:hypothetical protein